MVKIDYPKELHIFVSIYVSVDMPQNLSDHLYKSKFSLTLVHKASKAIIKKGAIQLDKDSTKLTEGEKLTLKLFEYFTSLQRVLQDIENVLVFLKIDTKKIRKIYPLLDTDEEYYKYHFENYIIRVISLQDIVGKLGNILYKTNIDDEKCNGYNFKEALKKNGNPKHSYISAILEQSIDIKKVRHKKLHRGIAEINNLRGVVFWDDLEKATSKKFDRILHEMSAGDLSIQINEIEKETVKIIDLIIEFFDNSLDELNNI